MGKSKRIVDGVVVEIDDNEMVKTIENGMVVEKPLNSVKKKEDISVSNTSLQTGGVDPSQSTSPIPSPSQSNGAKLPNDPFDISKLFVAPTVDNLDAVERKQYNAQLPGFTSPEKVTEAVKGIIDKRNNPAVRVSNAKQFLADDIDQSGVANAQPFPEKYKQQIVDGDGADSNINVGRYFQDRNKQIDDQIKALQSQQSVEDYGATNFAGNTTDSGVKAPNYDQLQAQIAQLNNYKGTFSKYATTLVAQQAAKQIPLPVGADINAKKEANRKVGLEIQKITNPLAAENKQKNIESSVESNRHPELVDVENYRLESDGLNARQFAINADYNSGAITYDDYIAQTNEITNQSKQLFDLHPEAKRVAQAQALGQIIQENRAKRDSKIPLLVKPGSVWENVVNYGISEDDIRAAAKDPRIQMSEADIKAQINNKNDIPGTSFLGNIYNKFIVHSGSDLIAPLAHLMSTGSLRTDAQVEAERYSKEQQFQFNAAQAPTTQNNINLDKNSADYLQQVANPDAGQHNWGYGTLNSMGDAVGTLGQLWLATETTGMLGDVAFGGTIGAETVGVQRTASALNEAKTFTAAQRNLFGNVTGMMLTGYNENKAASKEFIGEAQGGENAQNLYALTRSMETGLLFGMGFSPQTLISKALGREGEQAAAKKFADMIPNGIENLSEKSWSNYLKDNLALKIGIDALKENTKATTMMAIDQAVGIGTQAMFNPQSVDAKNMGHDILNNGIHNFLTFAPISLFGAGVSALNAPHLSQGTMEKEALYRAGLDPVQYAEYVNGQVSDGTVKQAEADKRIQLVNAMADIQKGVPEDLSRSEKVDFANSLLFEKKYQSELADIKSQPLIAKKEAQIKDMQNRQEEIINNSTGIEKDANGRPIIKTQRSEDAKVAVAQFEQDKAKEVARLDQQIFDLYKKSDTNPEDKSFIDQRDKLLSKKESAIKFYDEKINSSRNEILPNETKSDQTTSTEITNSETAKSAENISNSAPTEVAPDKIVVDEQTKALLEPHKDMLVFSEMKTDGEKLKFIAEQAQNISPTGEKMQGDAYLSTVDAFGDKLVSKAVELFPEEKLTGYSGLRDSVTKAEKSILPVLSKINNAENINEKELNAASDQLYNILDRSERSRLTKEQIKSTANLIEPLIQKIEGYDFRTKTETSTVTEKVPVQVAAKTEARKAIKPALEQIDGSAATITKPDGTTTSGQLRLNDGNYELVNEQGEKIATLGEKAINDRDVTLPPTDKIENPIEIDKDGNVKSITLQTKDGNLLTVNNPEKALDLAIQLSANVIDVPMERFDTVYQEIQKEISREVPVKDLSTPKATEKIKEPDASPSVETPPEKIGGEGAKLTIENFDKETKPIDKESGVRELNETGIKNEQTRIERQNRKLPEVEVELRRTFGEVFESGKKSVDNGKVDPRLLAKELIKKPRALNAEESVALIYDRMRLTNEHQKIMDDIIDARDSNNEVKETLLRDKMNQIEADMLINDEAARKTGYEQGLGLAARRMMIKEDYSLANQKVRYKVANDGKDLPKEIVEKLEKATKDLVDANKKLDAYEAEVNRLKAEKKVKNTTDGTKKVKKTIEEFKKDRQKITDNIAKKWKESSNDGTLTAVPIPYAKQLAAIAPEVAKMVKSYAEQGITELSEIVRDIHKNLSGAIPQITEKDVTDILAGQYDVKKTTTIDRQKLQLQANVSKIKRQIDLEKEKLRLGNRTKSQKVADYFFKWRRFALLSGIKVLGKIGVAAGARSFITSPIESVIGEGFRYIPGLKQLSEGAPREGAGFNPKAEAKALTQWVDKATYQDIREIMTTGKGQLDYVYAGELHPPTEWLDFFGQLHSAIKTLPKRGEFFRSFEVRAEHAAKNGKDLTDPFVQQEIGAAAYNDSLRAIFMQDNYITDAYRNTVNALERSEIPGSGTAANVLRFLFPIVKVPTNYVAEQSSYIVGGLKAAFAMREGISGAAVSGVKKIIGKNAGDASAGFKQMTPDQKDFVLRALKKQAIGAVFMTIGFLNPQAVGGYFSGKRKDDDLASGDLVLFGNHLPHWMVHTPLLEALQVGATLRRAHDANTRHKKSSTPFTGIPTVLQGVVSQVPFMSQSSQISSAFQSTDAFSKYLFRTGQSVVEPQLIKEIAEFTDRSNGEAVKRDPKDFLQQLQSGVPGLRQELPAKKSKGKY